MSESAEVFPGRPDGQRGDRMRTPDEVAAIITFLASGLATYATGSTIDINGASYVR